MIADIATGHTSGADTLFLIAAIVFGVAAICTFVVPTYTDVPERRPFRFPHLAAFLAYVGLTLVAIAFLVL
jgi:hypothetical protein